MKWSEWAMLQKYHRFRSPCCDAPVESSYLPWACMTIFRCAVCRVESGADFVGIRRLRDGEVDGWSEMLRIMEK